MSPQLSLDEANVPQGFFVCDRVRFVAAQFILAHVEKFLQPVRRGLGEIAEAGGAESLRLCRRMWSVDAASISDGCPARSRRPACSASAIAKSRLNSRPCR